MKKAAGAGRLLPSERAFVVQFGAEVEVAGGQFVGRVPASGGTDCPTYLLDTTFDGGVCNDPLPDLLAQLILGDQAPAMLQKIGQHFVHLAWEPDGLARCRSTPSVSSSQSAK